MHYFVLFLCLLSAQAWGTTYYVRDTTACANNGDGTAYACATSGGAPGAIRNFANALLATFAAGDTVYICGTISSGSSFQWTNAMESGTAVAPIVVDGNCPRGDGTYDLGSFVTTAAYALRVTSTGPDYITLRNLTFSGGTTDNLSFNLSTTTGWRLENVVSQDTAGDGVDIDDAADGGITIDGLTIYRAALNGIMCNSTAGWAWRNLHVYDSGTTGANNYDGVGINDGCGSGSVLRDVHVYRQKGNLGGGIDIQDSTGAGTFRLIGAGTVGGEGSGYTAVTNTGTLREEVYGLVSHGNLFGVYLKDNPTGGHHLYHITTFGNTTTELKLGDTATSGDSMSVEIKNSVFGDETCSAEVVFWRDNASVTLDMDYNNYCPGGVFSLVSGGLEDFAGWQTASTQDTNSLNADPEYAGADELEESEDVCPGSNSLIVEAGTYLGAWARDFWDQPFGPTPNMGAMNSNCGRRAAMTTNRAAR